MLSRSKEEKSLLTTGLKFSLSTICGYIRFITVIWVSELLIWSIIFPHCAEVKLHSNKTSSIYLICSVGMITIRKSRRKRSNSSCIIRVLRRDVSSYCGGQTGGVLVTTTEGGIITGGGSRISSPLNVSILVTLPSAKYTIILIEFP